jgi:hypothetical protein
MTKRTLCCLRVASSAQNMGAAEHAGDSTAIESRKSASISQAIIQFEAPISAISLF